MPHQVWIAATGRGMQVILEDYARPEWVKMEAGNQRRMLRLRGTYG